MRGPNKLALALAAAGALAPGLRAGPLDDIDLRRIECLRARAREGGEAARNCLSAAERTYMDARREEFCSDPGAFCESLISPDSAAARDRSRMFVSPRCEAVPPRCGDIAPSHPEPEASFLTCISPRETGSGLLEDDAEFADVMRRSWGCDEGAVGVRTGPRGPEVVRRYRCDAARGPFDCATGRVRAPSGEASSSRERMLRTARARAAESAFEAAGAQIGMSGEDCVMTVPDYSPTLMAVVSHLPDVRRGESYGDYAARLTTDQQREELRDRTRMARRRAGRAFRAAGELLGDGQARFEMVSRGVLTEERIRAGEEAYAAARRGVLEYLRSLNPPPPASPVVPTAVTAAIESTELVDLRAFTRDPRQPGDARTVREVTEVCTASGRAFGDLNALNHTAPDRGSRVTICPAMLLMMEASNPRALVSVLAHELGHSIDPCRLGMLLPEVRPCYGADTPAVPGQPEEAHALAAWNARLDGKAGWTRCMSTPVPPVTYTGVGYGNSDYSARVLEAMAADGPRCLVGDDVPQLRCLVERNLIRGPARHCFMNAGNLIMDDQKCPTAHRLGMGYGAQLSSDLENSEMSEAYSDFIASRALPRALEAYTPPLGALGPGERASEILTTMPFYCGGGGFSFDDTHPGGRARIGIFASAPEVRSAVGCSPAEPAASANLPTAHCGGLYDRNEAFVPAPTGGP